MISWARADAIAVLLLLLLLAPHVTALALNIVVVLVLMAVAVCDRVYVPGVPAMPGQETGPDSAGRTRDLPS